MKRCLSVLLIVFSLMIWAVPVQAATIPAGFNTWPLQTTTDTLKAWTVTFSQPTDSNSVNSSNIYVKDDNNLLVKTTLTRSTDGASVQISPVGSYIAGRKYWLYMTGGLTTNNGNQKLTQPVAMPFLVSKLSSVTDSYSSLLTSFTVITSPDVCSVKINQNYMLYQGNNTYSLGMTGLKQGATVTVYAYDGTGNLLQMQTYTIN